MVFVNVVLKGRAVVLIKALLVDICLETERSRFFQSFLFGLSPEIPLAEEREGGREGDVKHSILYWYG